MFFPSRKVRFCNENFLKNSSFRTSNGTYVYEIVPKMGFYDKAYIYSHDIDVDIFDIYEKFINISKELNILIVLYDYHGYSFSSGECSERNCLYSLKEVIDIYKKFEIVLVGENFGSIVLMNFAYENSWKKKIYFLKNSYFDYFYKIFNKFYLDKPLSCRFELFMSIDQLVQIYFQQPFI